MATSLSLKSLFKNSRESFGAFKNAHYLNTLSSEKLLDLVLFSESDALCALMPDVRNKKVLFVSDDRHKFVFKKTLAQEPRQLVNFVYAPTEIRSQEPSYLTVFGDLNNMPFRPGSFDVVVYPAALGQAQANVEGLKTFSKLLNNGGRFLFSLKHPQLEHLLLNQHPAQVALCENSFTGYFRALRDSQLFMENTNEGVVDLSLKPFFTAEEDFDYYHDYKGTPISLALCAVKFDKGEK